jgi:hypothetical protein
MKRSIDVGMALTILTLGVGSAPVLAQDPIPDPMRVRQLPRQQLAGPRFGFTAFTGDVAEYRRAQDKSALMSQFGWQFETRIVSTSSGSQALMEWVVLVGGFEQDELNLSLSWLAGYRLQSGAEFGVGPNMSVDKEGNRTTSMVLAGGATLPLGEIYVPVNAALAFAEGGPRITALVGWIVG